MAVAKKVVTKKKAVKRAAAAPSSVQTLLNGQVIGTIPAEGSIGDAAHRIARDNGLKSYAILADGVKVTSEGASRAVKGHSSIEVFAKETRG